MARTIITDARTLGVTERRLTAPAKIALVVLLCCFIIPGLIYWIIAPRKMMIAVQTTDTRGRKRTAYMSTKRYDRLASAVALAQLSNNAA